MMNNRSGLVPVGYRVLIKPDEVKEVSDGGIYIPEMTRDRQAYQQQRGVIVDKGELAFQGNEYAGPNEMRALEPGCKVLMTKHGGAQIRGADKQMYFLCNDKDVTAIITEEGAGHGTK